MTEMVDINPEIVLVKRTRIDIHKYRKWVKDTDPEIARLAFVADYGREPAEMVIYKQLLLVGPIPESS